MSKAELSLRPIFKKEGVCYRTNSPSSSFVIFAERSC